MEIVNGHQRVIGRRDEAKKTRVFVCRGIMREVTAMKEREYDLQADRKMLATSRQMI